MAIANKLYLTSGDLISSIKRRANIPDDQSMISDNEILEFANEEMLLNFIPLVYSRHEDYYLVRQEIPLIPNKVRYPIPYRAIASKVREVALLDSSNGLREMTRISIDDVTHSDSTSGNSYPSRYYFEGEEVVLHVSEQNFNPNGTKLVIFYSLRPNALVDSSRVGVITNISLETDPNFTRIDFNGFPTNFMVGSEVDFIKTKSPHRVITYDKVITDAIGLDETGYIIVATSDIPPSLTIGDRVASAGETDLVNAPSDLHVMLAQMVAERVLEAIGDQAGVQAAGRKLAKMEENSALMLDNRSTGSPIKAKARNGTIRRSGLGNKRRKYSI